MFYLFISARRQGDKFEKQFALWLKFAMWISSWALPRTRPVDTSFWQDMVNFYVCVNDPGGHGAISVRLMFPVNSVSLQNVGFVSGQLTRLNSFTNQVHLYGREWVYLCSYIPGIPLEAFFCKDAALYLNNNFKLFSKSTSKRHVEELLYIHI